MNIQKIEKALDEFAKEFGFGKYDDLNVADLAYLLIRLNGIGRTALHRIEVLQDEKGEHTTPVFVEPGVTVKEVGLGESTRPEGEGPKDYRKMLDEVGGWDNELASVPAGGVREVIEEVEALRGRVAQLDGNVDEARGVFRRIRDRVGAEEGEHILTAFERKMAELEGEEKFTDPPDRSITCPLCNGSGVAPGLGDPNRPCSTCDGTGRVIDREFDAGEKSVCRKCGGSGKAERFDVDSGPCTTCNGTGYVSTPEFFMCPEAEEKQTPPIPSEVRKKLDDDVEIYGNAFALFSRGEWRRLDPTKVKLDSRGGGEFRDGGGSGFVPTESSESSSPTIAEYPREVVCEGCGDVVAFGLPTVQDDSSIIAANLIRPNGRQPRDSDPLCLNCGESSMGIFRLTGGGPFTVRDRHRKCLHCDGAGVGIGFPDDDAPNPPPCPCCKGTGKIPKE